MKVFFRNIHLYLSLAAGLVIAIVCITGAILVFEKEWQMSIYPERYRVKTGTQSVSIEEMVAGLQRQVPDAQVSAVKMYGDPGRTVELNYTGNTGQKGPEGAPKGGSQQAFLNPYTAEVAGLQSGRNPFFFTVFKLHRWLLMDDTGKLIVGISTVMFLFILITGIILWWPQHLKMLKQRLVLKWNAGWKRINHDLHIVVGFYSAIFLFIFAFTGLAWSFEWFNDGIYRVTNSENKRPEPPKSTVREGSAAVSFDQIYASAQHLIPAAEFYSISRPKEADGAITVTIMPADAAHERASDQFFFDQYSGELLGTNRFSERNLGQRVRATFYPVHVGSIGGMPGRIIAFLACIAGFTFPITGVILWINRLRKKKKPKKVRKNAVTPYA